MSFTTWPNTPHSYSRNPDALRQMLLSSARERPVRIGLLGDSRSGSGSALITAMQAIYHAFYGNSPESEFLFPDATGTYSGKWFGIGGKGGTVSASRINLNQVFPFNVTAGVFGPLFQQLVADAASSGMFFVCDHDNYYGLDPAMRNTGCFNVGGSASGAHVDCDVFYATNPSSDQIEIYQMASSTPSANGFAAGTKTLLATTTDAQQAGAIVPKRITVRAAYDGSANKYMQIRTQNTPRTGASVGADYLGARFRSVANPAGIVVQSLSKGGYNSSHLLTNHANCGPLMALLGLDIVLHWCGTNDIGATFTAAQHQANHAGNIAAINGWYATAGQPAPLHVLITPYTVGLRNDDASGDYNQYAGADQDLVNRGVAAASINMWRLMADLGLTYANESVSLTGATAWAPSTAYVVGNIVYVDNDAKRNYYKCIIAHTSVTPRPADFFQSPNSMVPPTTRAWTPIDWHLSDADQVHPGFEADRKIGSVLASALLGLTAHPTSIVTSRGVERAPR